MTITIAEQIQKLLKVVAGSPYNVVGYLKTLEPFETEAVIEQFLVLSSAERKALAIFFAHGLSTSESRIRAYSQAIRKGDVEIKASALPVLEFILRENLINFGEDSSAYYIARIGTRIVIDCPDLREDATALLVLLPKDLIEDHVLPALTCHLDTLTDKVERKAIIQLIGFYQQK